MLLHIFIEGVLLTYLRGYTDTCMLFEFRMQWTKGRVSLGEAHGQSCTRSTYLRWCGHQWQVSDQEAGLVSQISYVKLIHLASLQNATNVLPDISHHLHHSLPSSVDFVDEELSPKTHTFSNVESSFKFDNHPLPYPSILANKRVFHIDIFTPIVHITYGWPRDHFFDGMSSHA